MKRNQKATRKLVPFWRLMGVLIVLTGTMELRAQDIIVLRDSTKIEAVIKEVSESEVRYKRYSNQEGPDFVVKSESLSYIRYQNGDVDRFVSRSVDSRMVEKTNGQMNYENRRNRDWPMSYENRRFYLYGKALSYERLTEELKKYPNAYRFYKKNSDLGTAGAFMIWMGLSMDVAGIIVCATGNNDMNKIGIGLSVVGGLITTAGIPMCCVGFVRKNKVYLEYNRECGVTAGNYRTKGIRFDMQASENGVGLVMKF